MYIYIQLYIYMPLHTCIYFYIYMCRDIDT